MIICLRNALMQSENQQVLRLRQNYFMRRFLFKSILKLSIGNSIGVAWLFNVFGFFFGTPILSIEDGWVSPLQYLIDYLCELMFILFTFDAIKFSIKADKKERPKGYLSVMVVINSIISVLYCVHLTKVMIWGLQK